MGLALGLVVCLVNFGCTVAPVVITIIKNYLGGI
jgi:hypothetical protein